jgi:PAS domain-containing protein
VTNVKQSDLQSDRPGNDTGAAFGVLVLDADGRVVAANSSARELWRAGPKPLVGIPLVGLLGSDAVGSEPGFAIIQWELLRKAALDRLMDVSVQPVDGRARRRMRLRLERSQGGAGTFIALLLPDRNN